jgi:glycerate 2-kinase
MSFMKLQQLHRDAHGMIYEALESVKPQSAVRKALTALPDDCKSLYLLAIGKAAYSMAEAAAEILGDRIIEGIVITKYGHVQGELKNIVSFEAGHPIPDENSLKATRKALELADRLTADDRLIFLISGGGSALFEHSDLSLSELQEINRQLLTSGADIVSMNTLRKRFSNVKGGQFAERVKPAHIFSIVLSDVLGDRLDMIASGPAYPDHSTSEEAKRIVVDYGIELSEQAIALLDKRMPQNLPNVTTEIVGSVRGLIDKAEAEAKARGYETIVLSDKVDCEARELGQFLGTLAEKKGREKRRKLAVILGGETVVTVRGDGIGGRNQEIALASVPYLANVPGSLVFSVGSDGTDGPTDAAGGIVDNTTLEKLAQAKFDVTDVLKRNDSYTALKAVGGLLITGPTGTNVNDLTCLMLSD